MTVGRPPGSGSPFNTSEKDGRASGDLPAAALYSMLPRLPRREGSQRASRLLRGPRTWARMSRRPGGTRGAGAPAAGPQEGLISQREVGGTPRLGRQPLPRAGGEPVQPPPIQKGQARKTHHRELFLGKLSQSWAHRRTPQPREASEGLWKQVSSNSGPQAANRGLSIFVLRVAVFIDYLSICTLLIIDYLSICTSLKAATRHCFLKLWQTPRHMELTTE